VHLRFIDFIIAYDTFRRENLCNNLNESGILIYLMKLIKLCLNETCSKVWVGKQLSDMFPITRVLIQEGAGLTLHCILP
jgi:hypothetical protein